MKTYELIVALWEADPKNQCDVVCGNEPIVWANKQPYYYDGRAQFVEHDADGNVVKCGWRTTRDKVRLATSSIEDVVTNSPEVEIDMSGLSQNDYAHMIKQIERWRDEGRKLKIWSDEAHRRHKAGLPMIFPRMSVKEWLLLRVRRVVDRIAMALDDAME